MKHMLTTRRLLLLIILLGALLRFHGLNWDQGFHLHPDERAIVMTVDKLTYPATLTEFFSPDGPWNPKFFAYGSFPMYLLQWAGNLMGNFSPQFAEYSLINLVGRFLSALFDLGTIFLLFLLGRKLFKPTIGLIASFLYAISVLPIQLSHFYAVDTILTFFITASLYMLILMYEKPTIKKSLLAGLFFGLALATKVSAIVVLFSVVAAFFIGAVIHFIKSPKKSHHYIPEFSTGFKNIFTYGTILIAAAFVSFIFFEPYAFIDNKTFWEQTLYQSLMTKDAFVFPYTLQYVGKIPYLFELQNIFLFGLGPLLATICFVGTGYVVMTAVRKNNTTLFAKLFILIAFFISYFWVVGGFAIGFMRYMLPVYPLFCLFGAVLVYYFYQNMNTRVKNRIVLFSLFSFLFSLLLVWPLSFIQIYSRNNPRTDATVWINQNIPAGKALAIEHWDDGLPLMGQETYMMITLGLYESDTPEKWILVKSQLEQTDYIIIASNRLYTPLQKLTDCEKLPPGKCYLQTTAYYQKLFSGQLGFTKIAEFTNYPTVPLLNIQLDDQSADESFTVYDHPKVMIFQKTGPVAL
jgi:4-amino-4-deoxy-L-arabinose transferase-like glycosyltransferase